MRIDRRGIIKLRWPGPVVAKIGITAVGSHKMVEISVEGVTKTVRFEGSSVTQAVRCAGMSIQRRLVKAAKAKSIASVYDDAVAQESRASAIAKVGVYFPEVEDGDGMPKTSFVGPICLYFNALGTVDVTLARLSNLSAERAGKIARAIHDLLADVMGDTTEIDLGPDPQGGRFHGQHQ